MPAANRAGLRRALRLFGRAARLRCPHCGGRPIFVTWSRMVPNCPKCGIKLERGERGYWLGAYFFNLVAIETIFVLWWVVLILLTWPSPPWTLLHYGTIGLMVVSPVLCFPFSKTFFFAFDLLVRPAAEEDFESPHEAARRPRIRRPR